MVQALGKTGEDFRTRLYKDRLSGLKASLSNKEIVDYLSVAKRFVEASIDANCRSDRMYHSYNLIDTTGDEGIGIDRLPVLIGLISH